MQMRRMISWEGTGSKGLNPGYYKRGMRRSKEKTVFHQLKDASIITSQYLCNWKLEISWDFAGLAQWSQRITIAKGANVLISVSNSGQQVGAAWIIELRGILSLCLSAQEGSEKEIGCDWCHFCLTMRSFYKVTMTQLRLSYLDGTTSGR